MLNAVGIDVSKGKSTVAVLQPGGVVVRKPFNVVHSISGLKELKDYILSLEGETRAVMECTGRYHEPVLLALSEAGIFVSAVNPHLIKNFGNNSIRKVKSDPADAKKIAKYALSNWEDIHPYTSLDDTRSLLKQMNSQRDFYVKQKVTAKVSLISLLDMTFPGANEIFVSCARPDGSEKWIDFVSSFWHVDCVRKLGLKAFTERYHAFCKRYEYLFSKRKAREIFEASKELVATVPKEKGYKDLIEKSVEHVRIVCGITARIQSEMLALASTLPEFPVVMSMKGVGNVLGPQLMAEIGDITRFTHREAITAFAGVDPGVDDSGSRHRLSVPASKCGSARLRKTLFQVMSVLIQREPDDPVYRFLDKKRSEGKPYNVYMTASANKFLRIYYGKVKAYLAAREMND